jgi:hypothetical protein
MSFENFEKHESHYFGRKNDSSDSESQSTMIKIARFIDGRQISISDFWQSDRNYASAAEIVAFCRNWGLNLPEYDVINLKS